MKVNKMLKTLKIFVLLTTVSCGDTSNLNNTNNLNNITNNNNIINNNLDNIINENEDNNEILNTNECLGKKVASKEVIKDENNAYEYLFNLKNNKYFRFENIKIEISNPEYNQFMENLETVVSRCLYKLFYVYEDEPTETIELLQKIRVNKKFVKRIAKKFDSFKFPDKKSYILANNNLSNLNKYIIKNKKSINEKGISFCNFYICYVYNHINKLYYQTENAVKKSIDKHEQVSKQIKIVNEFGRVLENVLQMISRQIENENYYIYSEENSESNSSNNSEDSDDESNDLEKYRNVLNDIDDRIGEYLEDILSETIKEFNYNPDRFKREFNDMHDTEVIYDLNKIIKNIGNYKIIKIDTTNDEELKTYNKELFDELLTGLNIENNIEVLNCKDFLINGRKDITIKQYLPELVSNINVLKNITDQKIKYQIEHEHIITSDKSFICYKNIVENILDSIKEQCKEDNILCDKLEDILYSINHDE